MLCDCNWLGAALQLISLIFIDKTPLSRRPPIFEQSRKQICGSVILSVTVVIYIFYGWVTSRN